MHSRGALEIPVETNYRTAISPKSLTASFTNKNMSATNFRVSSPDFVPCAMWQFVNTQSGLIR